MLFRSPYDGKSGGCRNATLETQSSAGGVAVLAIYYDAADPGFTKGLRFGNGALLVPFLIHVCAEYSGHSSVPTSAPKDARVCGIYGFHHTRPTERATRRKQPTTCQCMSACWAR